MFCTGSSFPLHLHVVQPQHSEAPKPTSGGPTSSPVKSETGPDNYNPPKTKLRCVDCSVMFSGGVWEVLEVFVDDVVGGVRDIFGRCLKGC